MPHGSGSFFLLALANPLVLPRSTNLSLLLKLDASDCFLYKCHLSPRWTEIQLPPLLGSSAGSKGRSCSCSAAGKNFAPSGSFLDWNGPPLPQPHANSCLFTLAAPPKTPFFPSFPMVPVRRPALLPFPFYPCFPRPLDNNTPPQ